MTSRSRSRARTEEVDKDESITKRGTHRGSGQGRIDYHQGRGHENVTKDESITISGKRTENVSKDETLPSVGPDG